MHKILPGWVACAAMSLAVFFLSNQVQYYANAMHKLKRECVQRGFATLQYDLRGDVFMEWKNVEDDR